MTGTLSQRTRRCHPRRRRRLRPRQRAPFTLGSLGTCGYDQAGKCKSPGGVRHCRLGETLRLAGRGYRHILVYCGNARPDARSLVACVDLGSARREAAGKQSGLLPVAHGTEVREVPAVFSA